MTAPPLHSLGLEHDVFKFSLAFLYRTRPRGMATPCRLPECSALVMRNTGRGAQQWFCGRPHAAEHRRRRTALAAKIDELSTALQSDSCSRGSERALRLDLQWLQRVAHLYVSPDEIAL